MKRWFQRKKKTPTVSTPQRVSRVEATPVIDPMDVLIMSEVLRHDSYHAPDYGSQHDSSSRHDSDSGGSSYDSGGGSSYDSGSSDCGGCGCD